MRVLLLEDDLSSADIYASHLRKSGFAVDHVVSISEADDALAVANYDILLLDRQVPDGDSRAWLEDLRKKGISCPAFFMTVLDAIEDRVDGLDAGADDYLPKPIAPAELEARVRAILRRPSDTLPLQLTCGSLSFDPANRQAAIADTPVQLTRREGSMLEHLLRRSGQVVPKASLEDGLYGYEDEVTPNSVEVCVFRLRKRLADAGADVEIHTVRGVGYLIRERQLD